MHWIFHKTQESCIEIGLEFKQGISLTNTPACIVKTAQEDCVLYTISVDIVCISLMKFIVVFNSICAINNNIKFYLFVRQ